MEAKNKLLEITTKLMLGIPKQRSAEDVARFQNEVVEEIKDSIPEMFEMMVEQKIKDLGKEISDCENSIRIVNLNKQYKNCIDLKEKIWSGYYNASH